jgi:hypothetical protein
MTRDQAIELARHHAKALPQSYYAEPFMPHEWVIQALLDAPNEAQRLRVQDDDEQRDEDAK